MSFRNNKILQKANIAFFEIVLFYEILVPLANILFFISYAIYDEY